MKWFARSVMTIVLIAVLVVGGLWGIKLTGYGYLLAASPSAPEPLETTIPFAPGFPETGTRLEVISSGCVC